MARLSLMRIIVISMLIVGLIGFASGFVAAWEIAHTPTPTLQINPVISTPPPVVHPV